MNCINDVNDYVNLTKSWIVAKYLMFSYLHLTSQLKPQAGICAQPQLLWIVKSDFFDLTGHLKHFWHWRPLRNIVTFGYGPADRDIKASFIAASLPSLSMYRCVFTYCVKMYYISTKDTNWDWSTSCHSPFSIGADVQRVSHGRYYHIDSLHPSFLSPSTVKRVSGEIKPLTFHLSAKIARSQTDSCSLYEVWLQYPPCVWWGPPLSASLRYGLFLQPTSNVSITLGVMGNMLMRSSIARLLGAHHSPLVGLFWASSENRCNSLPSGPPHPLISMYKRKAEWSSHLES